MSAQHALEAATVTALAPKITASNVVVTPDVAKRWLASNIKNRVLNPDKIAQYARAMTAGHWTISNDDICFDPNGMLLNGQHRLHAVIKSRTSVLMSVKRGVPTDAMRHMDRGRTRTYAQQLTFAGEQYSALLGSTLRQLVMVQQGLFNTDTNNSCIGDDEMNDFLDQHPQVRHSVKAVDTTRAKIATVPTALSVTHYLISQLNDQSLASFYLDQLASRANEPSGSAVLAVDSRLRSIERAGQRFPVRNHVYLLIKGWNYYAEGKPVGTLNMAPRTESFTLPSIKRWSR